MSVTFMINRDVEGSVSGAGDAYRQSVIDCGFEINMSNSNAFMVMRTLGMEPDYCGNIEPQAIPQFIYRCNQALAAIEQFPSLDSGREAEESRGIGGALLIDCGVRTGYLYERIQQLRSLAMIAQECRTYITFC